VTRRLEPGILATCVVPWDEQHRFLEADFRQHLALVARAFTRHVYIFGTAGEGYAVTDDQFAHIAEIFHDESLTLGIEPMLGVISLSLGTVIERIELGQRIGFRSFQLSFPSWGALTDRERDVFFDETCGRFQDCSFLHYNTVRGRVVLSGSDYRRLAARHENLVAVKFSSSDTATVTELVENAAPLQCFLTEYAYALAKERYECGLLLSLSGFSGALAHALVAASGDRLAELMAAITELDDLLGSYAGRDEVHMDGAEEKIIARVHGANLPLRLLPPYSSADEAGFEGFAARVGHILDRLGLED
jgi:dihydrodipicolinate synthase/N-acetylneuraminate lyase